MGVKPIPTDWTWAIGLRWRVFAHTDRRIQERFYWRFVRSTVAIWPVQEVHRVLCGLIRLTGEGTR